MGSEGIKLTSGIFPGAPGDSVEVADRVDGQQHVHTGDRKEVQSSREDTTELEWVEQRRSHKTKVTVFCCLS